MKLHSLVDMRFVVPSFKDSFRLFRTVRHFPVGQLLARLTLRAKRGSYSCPKPLVIGSLPEHFIWRSGFLGCLLSGSEALKTGQMGDSVRELLSNRRAVILSETIDIPYDVTQLQEFLKGKSALWRENFNYLEWLWPLLEVLRAPADYPEFDTGQMIDTLVELMRVFWQLPENVTDWSTYGCARRVIFYSQLMACQEQFPTDFKIALIQHAYTDSCRVWAFLETDLGGNHLIKDMVALSVAVRWFIPIPDAALNVRRWETFLNHQLTRIVSGQILPDGVHFERAPMYHVWVLLDLLDLIQLTPVENKLTLAALKKSAQTMLEALTQMTHLNGQVPMLGDGAPAQTPALSDVIKYAEQLGVLVPPTLALPRRGGGDLIAPISDYRDSESSELEYERVKNRVSHFEQAGLTILRTTEATASLSFKWGELQPKNLPAHNHADIATIELHGKTTSGSVVPILVDAGTSLYEPGIMREYFRSSAAHNTLWVPEQEQAELWGSFRVAEYPHMLEQTFEQDDLGAKVSVRYENYSASYEHHRSIYAVNHRFWVVQDWLPHLLPADRTCYSLLHIHPDLAIRFQEGCFTILDSEQNPCLLIQPFGMKHIEWSTDAPWREHLNLYAEGFGQARPGKLIAAIPKLPDCFGWVLLPCSATNSTERPILQQKGESSYVSFPKTASQTAETYSLTWDSQGLQVLRQEASMA